MSVPTHKVEKNYTLNLKISYTKCFSCNYDFGFSKDALVCNCSTHWYCSTQCRDQYKDKYCLAKLSLYSFYSNILRSYDTETLNMVKEYISSQEGVSRKDMKKLAEAGDWKDYLLKSFNRFQSYQMLLHKVCLCHSFPCKFMQLILLLCHSFPCKFMQLILLLFRSFPCKFMQLQL